MNRTKFFHTLAISKEKCFKFLLDPQKKYMHIYPEYIYVCIYIYKQCTVHVSIQTFLMYEFICVFLNASSQQYFQNVILQLSKHVQTLLIYMSELVLNNTVSVLYSEFLDLDEYLFSNLWEWVIFERSVYKIYFLVLSPSPLLIVDARCQGVQPIAHTCTA